MRATFLTLVATAVLAVGAAEARAQYFVSPYYAAPTTFNYTYNPYGFLASAYTPPVIAPYPYVPPVYTPPYLWSGRYVTTPYATGFSYERYYPYTNQYFYQYRVRPRWGW